MYSAQGLQPQQPWSPLSSQHQGRQGPPPAKKPRVTGPYKPAVVTRYAPPPGYQGPAQPQALFPQHATWQQPGQPMYAPSLTYAGPQYQGWPPAGYGVQPQVYQQPQYPGYPPQQDHQQLLYPQHGSYPNGTPTYQVPPNTTWPYIQGPQSYAPPTSTLHSRHNSVAHSDTHSEFANMTSTQVLDNATMTPFGPDPLDTDEPGFFDECYFASHSDEINPDLSLGWIDYKPAVLLKRPLAPIFVPGTLGEDDCILSTDEKNQFALDYVVEEHGIKTFRSVCSTHRWKTIKGDPVFQKFSAVSKVHLATARVLETYKERSDPAWEVRDSSDTPEPNGFQQDALMSDHKDDCTNSQQPLRPLKREYPEDNEQDDILGTLEQALQQNGHARTRTHSRASSVASTSSQRISRPVPVHPVRDSTQEDILASLGVTGSPKLVYETPAPAVGVPNASNRSRTSSFKHNDSSFNHNRGLKPPRSPPPPPPTHGRPNYHRASQDNTWRSNGHHHANGFASDRPLSSGSHGTAVESDFAMDDDATPRPKLAYKHSRKRTHEDSEDSAPDDKRRQDDNDATPKQQRKLPRVDDAYQRRWS